MLLGKNNDLFISLFIVVAVIAVIIGCSNTALPKNEDTDDYLYTDYPEVNLLTATSLDFVVKTKKDVSVYYLVLDSEGTAPTVNTIQYGLDGNGNEDVPASGSFSAEAGTEATVEISGLENSIQYYIYLALEKSNGTWSDLYQFGFESGSIAPDLDEIPVEQDWDGVTIYWVDNSEYENGYVIRRSTSENFLTYDDIYVVGADETEYLDTEFTPDSYNYYKVASYRDIQSTRYVSDFTEYDARYCIDTDFESDYSFVFLPDTQFYADYPTLNEIFYTQNSWLADNADSMGIGFVAGLGDIVDDWSDSDEWEVADKAYAYFDDGETPYGVCRGNHDSPSRFVEYFPSSRWQDDEGNNLDYYGGHSDNGYNSYYIVNVDGQDFLFLFFDYNTSYTDADWIEGVLNDYPTIPTILIDHIFLSVTNNTLEPSEASIASARDWIRTDIIEPNPQIFMLYCGHNHGSSYLTLQNDQGWDVFAMLCDYQMAYRQGNGWVRFMNFNVDEGIIQGLTYSPYVDSLTYDEKTEAPDDNEVFLTESTFYSDHKFKIEFDIADFIENLEALGE